MKSSLFYNCYNFSKFIFYYKICYFVFILYSSLFYQKIKQNIFFIKFIFINYSILQHCCNSNLFSFINLISSPFNSFTSTFIFFNGLIFMLILLTSCHSFPIYIQIIKLYFIHKMPERFNDDE